MNSRDELLKHLREEKQKTEQNTVDWDDVRRKWKEQLQELMSNIKTWTKPAKEEGLLSVEDGVEPIREEDLGVYDAPSLRIKTPSGKLVDINPVARMIIGAEGRVDIISGGRKATLIVDSKDTWVFSNPQARKQSDLPLDEETFFSVFDELIR